MEWMMRWMPDCDQSAEILWENLVRSPSLRSRIGLWIHLMVCRECRGYRRDLNWVSSTLDHLDSVARFSPHYKLPEGIKQRLKTSIPCRSNEYDGMEDDEKLDK